MGELFGNSNKTRGCFHVAEFLASGGHGAQLVLGGGTKLPAAITDPVLVIGFDCSLQESVLFNKCFCGRTYTYAFGHDPDRSTLSVNMIGFLRAAPAASGGAPAPESGYELAIRSYKENRVSEQPIAAYLLLGKSNPLSGFLAGVTANTVDPQYGLQNFTFHLVCPTL